MRGRPPFRERGGDARLPRRAPLFPSCPAADFRPLYCESVYAFTGVSRSVSIPPCAEAGREGAGEALARQGHRVFRRPADAPESPSTGDTVAVDDAQSVDGVLQQRPLDGDRVDDDLDGLGCRGVTVGPAGDLVEVAADARDLPGALALNAAAGAVHVRVRAIACRSAGLPGIEGGGAPRQTPMSHIG